MDIVNNFVSFLEINDKGHVIREIYVDPCAVVEVYDAPQLEVGAAKDSIVVVVRGEFMHKFRTINPPSVVVAKLSEFGQ